MMQSHLRLLAGALGVLAGALAGSAVFFGASPAVAHRLAGSPSPAFIEATHLPPLLTEPGEQVELRYDVYCGREEEGEAERGACDAVGKVFIRTGESGTFGQLPLRVDPSADEGRYVALVPSEVVESRAGFSYYAVFRSDSSGAEVSVPGGGESAPQRSVTLGKRVKVRLGMHAFGRTRKADRRAAEAAWGDGPTEVGLEQSRNLPPIGGASFDVDRAGTVSILDEAHRRLLRWENGGNVPARVPLAINGTLADMSIADDGRIYVLESTDAPMQGGLLRAFGRTGSALGASKTAERATEVRIGPNGPVLLQQPSGQWMEAGTATSLLTPAAQRRSGRAGRPLAGGGEVVVLRLGNEIRAAIVDSSGARRAWQVTSETPLAEVQLADPVGSKLVLVARVYTDERDEFIALVLGANGLVRSFSLDSAGWAETAPLSRFRLVGSSLYQLGSTPAGLFVDRFDLEVK